jgi:hypothetical protein
MQQGIEAAFWRETQFSINACCRQQLTQSQQQCGRRQPSLHMHCVTEEEAKKRCFVGLHIRPDRHESYNKRDASEKQEGTHEQPRTGRAAFRAIDIFAHS